MARNIVPRINKDADLGTPAKNWDTVYANRLITGIIALNGSDLQSLLDGKTNLDTLIAKGDLYVATGAGIITRLPRGNDGEILKVNSGTPEGLQWAPGGAQTELTSDITVTVGTGGNYATINDALASLVALYYPVYLATGSVPQATIRLLSGFVMAEQVLVEGLDLSWITITGVDAETMITRSALTRPFFGRYPAFGAARGTLPVIGQLFNMDASGAASLREGVFCSFGRCKINGSCGVKNAGNNGILADKSSTIDAHDANASGAGEICICADQGSTINARNADASGAGNVGILTNGGSTINAHGATGTLNQTANTITSNGIIFQ